MKSNRHLFFVCFLRTNCETQPLSILYFFSADNLWNKLAKYSLFVSAEHSTRQIQESSIPEILTFNLEYHQIKTRASCMYNGLQTWRILIQRHFNLPRLHRKMCFESNVLYMKLEQLEQLSINNKSRSNLVPNGPKTSLTVKNCKNHDFHEIT